MTDYFAAGYSFVITQELKTIWRRTENTFPSGGLLQIVTTSNNKRKPSSIH